MIRLLLLALGGALGTLARHGLNGLVTDGQSNRQGWAALFPLGTMMVNITGCFIIGLLAAWSGPALGRDWMKPHWRDLLMVGFCGGYTTFSSFGLQTLHLARDGEWWLAALNILGTNALCLVAVWLGWLCGRALPGHAG